MKTLLTGLFAALPSLAFAQPAPPTAVQAPAPAQVPASSFSAEPIALMIAAFDANADARVTRAEFDAGVLRTFPEGGDNMGLIQFGKWSVRWLGHQGALPGQFDFDRDGDDRISRSEYAAQFERSFTRFDANRDATLDRSELVAISAQRLPTPGRGERKRERRQD